MKCTLRQTASWVGPSVKAYMKSKNWRIPRRHSAGSTPAQRALAELIIQSRKDFRDEFGEEA